MLAELLCTAWAAKGGDDAFLPSKGSVSIPAKENAAEAMRGKLKGSQNGNNTVSEAPYHSYHFLEIKSEMKLSAAEKKQTLLSNPPSDGYKLLISSRPPPSNKDAFFCPSFHPTPSLCPANPTFSCWARSWIHLSGSRGAECVGSGCKEGQ